MQKAHGSPAENVLALSLAGIGNLIMHTPTLATLKHARPQWKITVWVAPRGTRTIAQSLPYIDNVIEAPTRNSLTGHLRTAATFKHLDCKVGIVLTPGQHLKSAGYLYAAHIPLRVGATYPLANNPSSSLFLTQTITPQPAEHFIDENLRLLSLLNIDTPSKPEYTLPVPRANIVKAQQFVAALGVSSKSPIVGIHPGCAPGYEWKRWPMKYFAAVAKSLIQTKNAHVLIFGGPNEHDLKDNLYNHITRLAKPSQATIVSTDILTTAAVIKQCDTFLANDSGLMHIAASVGTRTIGLFGPTDENRTGPRGTHSSTIRAQNTHPVYNVDSNYNLGETSHETMMQLKPDIVLSQLQVN